MVIDFLSFNKAAIYLPGHGYSVRPAGMSKYRSILVHTTNGRRGSSFYAEAKYIFQSAEISSHFLIGKDGQLVCFLKPKNFIAWHAGRVRATAYSNPYSIGIEMHNTPTEGHCTDAQLRALDELVRLLMKDYLIEARYVETHRYAAVPPGRKIDPSGFPDSEFYVWRETLELPHTTNINFRVINVKGVNVRQAPNLDAPIAGTLAYDTIFESDVLKNDENGVYLQGTNKWAHMVSGLGFVHCSNLKVVT